MTPELRQKLKSLLIDDEKYRQFLYPDTTGHQTIGIGRNLSARGISLTESLMLLDDDILYFSSKLASSLTIFNSLEDVRKIVLINMCFNLGFNGLLEFHKMLEHLKNGDYESASLEILQSKAASQCPYRYQRLAHIMKTGEL